MMGALVDKTATGKYSAGICQVSSQPAHVDDHPLLNKRETTVAIVDDEPSVRTTIRHLLHLSPNYVCVAEYASASTALTGIPSAGVQVVLMDIRMPGMSGLECTRRLLRKLPRLKVVIVSASADEATFLDSVEAECVGYVVKPFSKDQLYAALRCALFVWNAPTPKILGAVHAERCARLLTGADRCPLVSEHQKVVLELIVAGLSQKQAADRLGCSREAVYRTLQHSYAKLGAYNCAVALVRLATCEFCSQRPDSRREQAD